MFRPIYRHRSAKIQMDVKNLYQNPKFPASFAGKQRFYDAVRSKDKKTKFKAIENALKSVDSYTLHKPVQKPQKYRRIFTKGIKYLYQIDLVDMTKFQKQNSGYRWIITIIDTFSKKAWAFKMKRKSAKSIMTVMVPFLRENNPQKMEFDQGTEFYNKQFINLLKKHKIKYYSVYSDRKCAIVERFNRTLKTRMYRSFTARGSHKWIDVLLDLIDGYNKTIHSSTKFAPNDVNETNEHIVRRNLYPRVKKELKHTKKRFEYGETVRISKRKSTFQKGYEQSHSYEVFTVNEVKDTYPVTYGLRDYKGDLIEGSFYSNELQAVDVTDNIWPIEKIISTRLKRGKTEYLVKFRGYPNEANNWIPQEDLFDL